MKAIRVHQFGGPDAMVLEEAQKLSPGKDQVLVRVRAAGVNPVDTYIRSGLYAKLPSLPYTPGHDGAGTVESIGEGVGDLAIGDRVYVSGSMSGTYAEHALCSASQVHTLPDVASFSQGAALGVPYGVAYRALFMRARSRPGETVLVHGATGGVGLAAVQLARNAGMVVLGTGGTEEGRELVLRQGADHAVDHGSPNHLAEVLELTHGRGVDVTLEMLANQNLGDDLKVLAPSGRVVVIGSRGSTEIDPRDTMGREAAILGVLLFNASEQDLRTIHAALGAGLKNGTIRPFIGVEFPLEQAPQAHIKVMEPRTYGKVILVN